MFAWLTREIYGSFINHFSCVFNLEEVERVSPKSVQTLAFIFNLISRTDHVHIACTHIRAFPFSLLFATYSYHNPKLEAHSSDSLNGGIVGYSHSALFFQLTHSPSHYRSYPFFSFIEWMLRVHFLLWLLLRLRLCEFIMQYVLWLHSWSRLKRFQHIFSLLICKSHKYIRMQILVKFYKIKNFYDKLSFISFIY